MAEDMEARVVRLVAADRLYAPMSSFDGKLKRRRDKLGKEIVGLEEFGTGFQGDRVYARYEQNDLNVARDIREAVDEFKDEHPKYGQILEGMIQQTRVKKEKHLYFGVQEGKRISQEDYMAVMKDLGLSEARAAELYPVVMDISRNLDKKRGSTSSAKERRVLIS